MAHKFMLIKPPQFRNLCVPSDVSALAGRWDKFGWGYASLHAV